MHWPGPLKGGVTQSLLSKFLECPYRFYIYAGLGLEEDTEDEPNLIYGNIGHYGLEHIIAKPQTTQEFTPEDWGEIYELMDAYIHKEYPNAPETFPTSTKRMVSLYNDEYKTEHGPFLTELKFSQPYTTSQGHNVTLRGKYDGAEFDGYTQSIINENTILQIPNLGDVLVEHKFKGKIDGQQVRLETPSDLQVGIYCYTSGCRTVIYDTIRIPDTQWTLPPRRAMERPKSYINSLYDTREWGDFPIVRKKHLWINQQTITLSEEQLEAIMLETVDPIIDRLCMYYEYVSDPNFDFQNPRHYNHLFYKTPIRHFDPSRTQSYKCSYYRLLTDQITLDDLHPVKSYYPELAQ